MKGRGEVQEDLLVKSNWNNAILNDSYPLHPAYEDYPVVNISIDAARAYCAWLEVKLAKSLEIEQDKITVRLPSKIEWIYAAKSGKSDNTYAWNGPYLRNSEGKFLANFNSNIAQENITYNPQTKKYEVVVKSNLHKDHFTAPVKSYLPNDFGLYNMSGNVSEFVNDEPCVAMGGSYKSTGYDIRTESELPSKEADDQTGFRPIVVFK